MRLRFQLAQPSLVFTLTASAIVTVVVFGVILVLI